MQLGQTALVKNRGKRFGSSSRPQLQGQLEVPGNCTVPSRVVCLEVLGADFKVVAVLETNMK